VRRLLAIVLLALLPLQFSWAAVAFYCGHEAQSSAGHFGHHEHAHHAHAGSDADRNASPLPSAELSADASGDKLPGAMDLDCGHCHGTCSMMLTLDAGVPGGLSASHPIATLDETGGAHAPTRPERPQWLPLA
jgi:hypothetical protein